MESFAHFIYFHTYRIFNKHLAWTSRCKYLTICLFFQMQRRKQTAFCTVLVLSGVLCLLTANLIPYGQIEQVVMLANGIKNYSLDYITSLKLNISFIKDKHLKVLEPMKRLQSVEIKQMEYTSSPHDAHKVNVFKYDNARTRLKSNFGNTPIAESKKVIELELNTKTAIQKVKSRNALPRIALEAPSIEESSSNLKPSETMPKSVHQTGKKIGVKEHKLIDEAPEAMASMIQSSSAVSAISSDSKSRLPPIVQNSEDSIVVKPTKLAQKPQSGTYKSQNGIPIPLNMLKFSKQVKTNLPKPNANTSMHLYKNSTSMQHNELHEHEIEYNVSTLKDDKQVSHTLAQSTSSPTDVASSKQVLVPNTVLAASAGIDTVNNGSSATIKPSLVTGFIHNQTCNSRYTGIEDIMCLVGTIYVFVYITFLLFNILNI